MIRYFLAALLLRLVDAGATVGLVLVCTARTDIDDPIRTAGLLGAALTAPHLAGPLAARWVDRARDPRWVIAAAGTTYAVFLAGAVLLLGRIPLPLVALLVVLAGLCGPILTGGLSSRLPELQVATVGRRRSSLDGLTYGLAGSLGPATVSVLAPLLGPLIAILVLIAGAVVGGALTLRIPLEPTTNEQRSASPALRETVQAIWAYRPLRRVALLTWTAALVVSATVLIGIARGQQLSPGHGGWVVAGFGLGALVAGLLQVARPPKMRADQGMTWTAVALAPLIVTAAFLPNLTALIALYALVGAADARMTAYSLAGRSELSDGRTRGTVFMTTAGVKVAFASAGTALAGLLVGLGPVVVLGTAAALLLSCAAWAGVGTLRARAHRLGTPCPPIPRSSEPSPAAGPSTGSRPVSAGSAR